MGKISEQLINLLKKQIAAHGLVVWYDPDQSYAGLANSLALPETTVFHYKDSFIRLRKEADSWMEYLNSDDRPVENCSVPPKLLLYLPMARQKTENALIEFEAAGVVMEPGAGNPERNTRMRIVAETVFRSTAPDQVDKIAEQIDAGALTLEELDHIADEIDSVGSSVIKLVFNTASPSEVVINFAASNQYDAALVAKNAVTEIQNLLEAFLGIDLTMHSDPDTIRQQLIKQLLLFELKVAFPKTQCPDAFHLIETSTITEHIELVGKICRTWRNRLDLKESYIESARRVESQVGLDKMDWLSSDIIQAVLHLQTFPAIEEKLIRYCEKLIVKGKENVALEIAENRAHSFWTIQTPRFQLKWSIIRHAACVLIQGRMIRSQQKKIEKTPSSIIKQYTDGEKSWCLVDTEYRRLEHQFALLDMDPEGLDDALLQMMAYVRSDYTKTLESTMHNYITALTETDFAMEDCLHQDLIFSTHMEPLLKKNKKTAYILVDALRFEMAKELGEGLKSDFHVDLSSAVSMLPSITAVGMAALLPGAEKGMGLTITPSGKLHLEIGKDVIKNRNDRIKHVQNHSDKIPFCCKLGQIIKPSKKIRDEITKFPWLLVTSQELDKWAEEGEGEEESRIFMEQLLDRLSKGIRRLAAMGFDHIIITADHGHLFGESIEGGMKMDPPGGDTIELHSRAWIGKGGKAAPGYIRVTADQIGLGGDLELAFPNSLACFKTKGGTKAYCHGGISLQEMIIPVMHLTRTPEPATFSKASVSLDMTGKKVTNRFFTVSAEYKEEEGLFSDKEIQVKVILKSGRKEVGNAVMASYGFDSATREITLKLSEVNPITLMITDDEDLEKMSIHVINAATHIELGRIKDIEVDIAI